MPRASAVTVLGEMEAGAFLGAGRTLGTGTSGRRKVLHRVSDGECPRRSRRCHAVHLSEEMHFLPGS
jgi:hypothetical protein